MYTLCKSSLIKRSYFQFVSIVFLSTIKDELQRITRQVNKLQPSSENPYESITNTFQLELWVFHKSEKERLHPVIFGTFHFLLNKRPQRSGLVDHKQSVEEVTVHRNSSTLICLPQIPRTNTSNCRQQLKNWTIWEKCRFYIAFTTAIFPIDKRKNTHLNHSKHKQE